MNDIRTSLLRIKELSIQLNEMTNKACEAIKRVENLFEAECHLTMRVEAPGIMYYQGRIYLIEDGVGETYWGNCKRDQKLEIATRLPSLLEAAVALAERTIVASENAASVVDSMLSDADFRPVRRA